MGEKVGVLTAVMEDLALLHATGAAHQLVNTYLRGVRRALGVSDEWILDTEARGFRAPTLEEKTKVKQERTRGH